MKAVYGFVFYSLSFVFLGVYVSCAVFPDQWLNSIGLTYIPSKYWLVAVPVYLMVAIVMLMGVYMSYSMLITPHLNEINTFRDSRSIYNTAEQNDRCVLNDIPITKVCKELYDTT